MSAISTLSEKIVLAVGTGKDPTELDNLETQSAILGALTADAAELNVLDGATAANAGTGKAVITGTSGALTIAGALTLGATALTATALELNNRNAGASRFVVIPDATPYAVLAADSGKIHIIAEQASTITINLPVHAVGLEYTFIMGGVATEAQNYVFVATTPSFWNGGAHWADLSSVASNTAVVYGNGTSHLTFTVVTPAIGTKIRVLGTTGGEWLLDATVVSDSTPTMA